MNEDKIILVEDDFGLRDLYTYVFQKAGYLMVVAQDGEEAVLLAKQNPDAKVILLDVMLPKMHGIDVLKKLKGDDTTKNIPVIFLSNLTEENIVQEGLKIGALAYIVKARVTPQQIVDKVKVFLTPQE